MSDFLLFISEILWESAMLYLLAGAGLWFSWRTRFIQFRYLRFFPRALSRSLRPSGSGLTAFEALCTSIARASAAAISRALRSPSSAAGRVPCSGCGSQALSAWPPLLLKTRWASSIKGETETVIFAAGRLVYGAWARHALAGRAVFPLFNLHFRTSL